MRPGLTSMLAALALVGAVATRAPAAERACDTSSIRSTDVLIDGDLYGEVARSGGYVFGWSDVPVLSFPQALRLIRLLGHRGTDTALLSLPGVRGVEFHDDGSYSAFDVHCPGTYEAAFLTRRADFARFWLQETRFRVERAYCMTPLLLPRWAIVRATVTVPLASSPPTYTVDLNRDGRIDRRGTFRRGGASFPRSTTCPA